LLNSAIPWHFAACLAGTLIHYLQFAVDPLSARMLNGRKQ